MLITKLTKALAIVLAVAALLTGGRSVVQWGLADSVPTHGSAMTLAFDVQDKLQLQKASEFIATIKKVKGNKVTLNRSTKDKKFDDVTLTAVKNVLVFQRKLKDVVDLFDLDPNDLDKLFDEIRLEEGLKSDVFAREVALGSSPTKRTTSRRFTFCNHSIW